MGGDIADVMEVVFYYFDAERSSGMRLRRKPSVVYYNACGTNGGPLVSI